MQAVLEATYRREGSLRDGFPAIVAAGDHSCTLHYTANRARIEDGELLLLDTGAEHDFYSADVTRTIPANGAFTPEQRAVYDIVLAAQRSKRGCLWLGRFPAIVLLRGCRQRRGCLDSGGG